MSEVTHRAARRILLTGATGYVGGRLLTQLVSRGYRVRCLARNPAHLLQRVPAGVEVVAGDVTDRDSLMAAVREVDAIIYLGGLGDETTDLSPHLRSRQEVGRVLRESGVPTIEPRASIDTNRAASFGSRRR